MTQLFIWMIMAYGLSNILVYGSIFEGPRSFIKEWANSRTLFNGFGMFINDMLSCMMCTSTWVGFFFGLTIFSPSNHYFEAPKLISWFFDGMFSSGAVWAINSIIEWFEENRPQKNG